MKMISILFTLFCIIVVWHLRQEPPVEDTTLVPLDNNCYVSDYGSIEYMQDGDIYI